MHTKKTLTLAYFLISSVNMEPYSKLKHDPLLNTNNNTASTHQHCPTDLISNHLSSIFIELVKLSFLVLLLSVEALLFLQQRRPIFHFVLLFTCILLFIVLKTLKRPSPVYLVDFSCLRPPAFCRVPFSTFLENSSIVYNFDQDSMEFMAKVLSSSGQSQETYLPPPLHYIPPKTRQQDCIGEVHLVLFPIFEDIIVKTNLSPQDVDFLIVNCSGFCPSPSLSSIIVNKYKLRADVKTYNLSGMGCSASALAVDLAQNLLKTHRNSNAVVLSTEILSMGWYSGNERPKLLLNCLFRMGSAAVLLTNKKASCFCPKYKLHRSFRTQRAFDDRSYLAAFREEDAGGKLGVTLTRDLLPVVGETLKANISVLGRSLLPLSEKLRVAASVVRKRLLDDSTEIYTPDFKKAVEHFCVPASGRGVIKKLAKGMRLGDGDVEPAMMTLHKFGNQSSSSLWYELAYLEAKERVEKGDKVWQLGMGTGTKCASLVWECLRPILGESNTGPWAHFIHNYPLHVADSH